MKTQLTATPGRKLSPESAPGMRRMPAWLSGLCIGGVFAGLILLELLRPLRSRKAEPKLRRNVRNMAVAATSGTAIMLTSGPVSDYLSKFVQRRNWGLVKRLRLPVFLEVPLALLLLDYTLYLWHVAFHKVPFLWRFHQVHHVDLDMDASTAIRFHFGEMVLSTGLQTVQVLAIGVSPLTLSIWNTWLLCEVIFHHSNVELPHRMEKWLCKIVVTPRMHGIHHSLVPEELNSNWSSGLTLWDRVHRTLRLNVPQKQITIGVAAFPEPEAVTFPKLMTMPVGEQRRPPWVRPDGTVPHRDHPVPAPPATLAPDNLPQLTEKAERAPESALPTRRV